MASSMLVVSSGEDVAAEEDELERERGDAIVE